MFWGDGNFQYPVYILTPWGVCVCACVCKESFYCTLQSSVLFVYLKKKINENKFCVVILNLLGVMSSISIMLHKLLAFKHFRP